MCEDRTARLSAPWDSNRNCLRPGRPYTPDPSTGTSSSEEGSHASLRLSPTRVPGTNTGPNIPETSTPLHYRSYDITSLMPGDSRDHSMLSKGIVLSTTLAFWAFTTISSFGGRATGNSNNITRFVYISLKQLSYSSALLVSIFSKSRSIIIYHLTLKEIYFFEAK